MGNSRKVSLIDGYREVGEVELICAFEVEELSGKYIIYTKNEHDRDGNTIIYSGKIRKIENNQYIENIESGHEWEKLKSIMKLMAKYSLEGENYV